MWKWLVAAMAMLALANAADARLVATDSARSGATARVALVIANGEYRPGLITRLANPGNDLRAVSKALRDAGWIVTERQNLTGAQMREALAAFRDVASGAAHALVYYSGSGATRGNLTYLAGVDLVRPEDLASASITHADAVAAVKAAVNGGFVAIDTSRDDPFPDKPLEPREIGSPRTAGGVIVYYSASPGDPAADGVEGISPFARSFAEALGHPGLEEVAFFRRVRERVESETDDGQTPTAVRFESSSAMQRNTPHGRFRFNATREPTAEDIARLESARPLAFSEQPRLALVIGNGDYNRDGDLNDDRQSDAVKRDGFAPDLPNTLNDAGDIQESLRRLKFDVTFVTNADYQQLLAAMNGFEEKVVAAGEDAIVVVYYAGHAIQVGGANFLIPVLGKMPAIDLARMNPRNAELALGQYALPLQGSLLGLLKSPSAKGLNLVILDACRENPWERTGRNVGGGASRGLGEVRTNLLRTAIAFATQPGDIADDGGGRNSPYTAALKSLIERPSLPVYDMLQQVMEKVQSETRDRQVPWTNANALGRTCLGLCPVEAAPAPVRATR